MIEFSTISKKLAKNIKCLLKKLEINYKEYVQIDKRGNRKPISRTIISSDFERFIKVIKPKHFNYLLSYCLIEAMPKSSRLDNLGRMA